jgi:hypothetical protein
VPAIIRKVKDYGYEGFETGFANVQSQFDDPAGAKAKLDAMGLKFLGVHIFLMQYDSATHVAPAELYERVAVGGAKLGAERLILSGAPPEDEVGRKRKAEALDRAGAFAQKLGLKLAYHNHGSEFSKHGEEIEFPLRETDPARVWFPMDAGHAFHAGQPETAAPPGGVGPGTLPAAGRPRDSVLLVLDAGVAIPGPLTEPGGDRDVHVDSVPVRRSGQRGRRLGRGVHDAPRREPEGRAPREHVGRRGVSLKAVRLGSMWAGAA